jgi:hypothetical protein
MRGGIVSVFVLLVIGIVAFATVARSPRFESFHPTDVLMLLGSGMCFGAALASRLRMSRERTGTGR